MIRCLVALTVLFAATPSVAGATEHFEQGEVRAGIMWDTMSAMDTGLLRFGGTAGIHVLHGIELGYEQHFIVPLNSGSQARTFGYLRVVPFRDWPVNPFVTVRAGYFFLPDRDAPAAGAGLGLVLFVDEHFAFEASLFEQAVFHPEGAVEQQTELDWRLVVYF